MKRLLLIVAVVVLIGVGGGLWWLGGSIDWIVAQAIERYGSDALGAPVSVGAVEIDLGEGRSTIRNLRVGNPKGFSAGDALRVGEATLEITPKSLLEPPIQIALVRLSAPRVALEVSGSGESNVGVLQRNATAYAPPSDDANASADEASDDEPIRLRIARVEFAKGELSADLRAAGGDERTLALPGFELANLGGARGAPAAELAKEFGVQLTSQLVRSAARARAMNALEEKASGLLEKAPGAGEAVKGLFRTLGGDED